MRERGHAVFVLSDQLGAFGLTHRAPPRLQYSSGPRRAATSVTGSDSYVLRVIATSVGHLEAVIETLAWIIHERTVSVARTAGNGP